MSGVASLRSAVKLLAVVLALAPGTLRAQESPTLKHIKDTGTITFGYRDGAVPISYVDKDGHPAGYSLDLCGAVVDQIKATLGLAQIHINYVPVNLQTRIPMLAAGSIDLECGATTDTLTREQQVDFSYLTFVGSTRLLVAKDSGIKDLPDLNGKTIALPLGSTNEPAILKLIADQKLNIRILHVKDHPEGFASVQTDRADAYATDEIALFGQLSTAKDKDKYMVVGPELTYEPLGLMMRRNDSEFRRQVNTALANLFRSGKILQIYAKWFGPLGMTPTPLFLAAVRLQSTPE